MRSREDKTIHTHILTKSCKVQPTTDLVSFETLHESLQDIFTMSESRYHEVDLEEKLRIDELLSLNIAFTKSEETFDDLVKLASRICQTRMAFITLVDDAKRYLKAQVGSLPDVECPRDASFSHHVIQAAEALLVPDARVDVRFQKNPHVFGEPFIVFYAGIPLRTSSGRSIGSISVADIQSHVLDEEQVCSLKVLAKHTSRLIESRKISNRITDLNKLLWEKNQEIQSRARFNQKLISIISHDVLTPFRSLEQAFDMKEEGDLSEEDWKDISSSFPSTISRCRILLENLLDWAASFGKGVTTDSVNVLSVISKEVSFLMASAAAKGNSITVSIPENLYMNVNAHVLAFIFRNLVTNAIKFTSEGFITLSCLQRDCFYEFKVEDTGVGMPDLVALKLFSPSTRKSNRGTCNELGSGMGLRLVHSTVTELGGDIKATSDLGKGTCVSVSLPLHLVAAAPPATE